MSAACPRCARRGFLLAALAGHVEKAVGARAGERSRDLLALDDERLAKALAPDDWRRRLVEADQAAANVAAVEGWSACAHSTPLPEALAVLGASAPRAIFGRGDPGLLAGVEPERAVTIVGSRRAGAYGREVAFELARALAGAGIVVISGLALGIDAAAHEGALAGSGRTLAVLGPGADRAYPRSAHGLYRRVLADGAVVSELAPGAPTFRWVFPARNRLMAALSGITVVVEAAGRSGSLITAEMAIDCGRAVGAVPGPVNSWRSSGTNQLLADGAAVVRDARDVLDALLGPGAVVASPPGPRLDPAAAAVLDAVEAGAATPDAIAGASGLDLQPALRALAALERGGYVSGDHAGRWSRTMQPAPAGEPRAAATAA